MRAFLGRGHLAVPLSGFSVISRIVALTFEWYPSGGYAAIVVAVAWLGTSVYPAYFAKRCCR